MIDNKYLISIDIDGTLRQDNGIISNNSKEIIKELVDKGHIVIICTARPKYHAEKVNNEIGASRYIICLSGAEIYDSFKGKYIYESFLDKKEILGIYNYAKENNIRMMFTSGDKEYVTKFIRNKDQVLLTSDNENIVIESPIKECMIIDSDKEKIKSFEEYIKYEYNSNIIVSSYSKDEAFLVIVSNNVSKGKALKTLRDYLGFKKEQIISFGNDSNDISMFNESGKGIAVSNATDDLLEIADDVTLSNNDDGVAIYLRKLK